MLYGRKGFADVPEIDVLVGPFEVYIEEKVPTRLSTCLERDAEAILAEYGNDVVEEREYDVNRCQALLSVDHLTTSVAQSLDHQWLKAIKGRAASTFAILDEVPNVVEQPCGSDVAIISRLAGYLTHALSPEAQPKV